MMCKLLDKLLDRCSEVFPPLAKLPKHAIKPSLTITKQRKQNI